MTEERPVQETFEPGTRRPVITRRRMLKLGTASGVAAAVTRTGFVPRAAAQGRELVVGFSIDPGHMDPRVEAGVPGWSIFHMIHDPFLWRDEKINPVPWLVTKWEQVNPTTLRWHLRKGVKFHNGEDFTAESVKTSFEQYCAPNSRSPWKSQLIVVKQFKISDPHTIDLITEKPNRPLLRNATQPMALSPRALRELGDRFPTSPVGTGQMRFVEYRPGQHVLMEANPNYWGKKSAFSRIRFRFIPENGTRLAALEAGEVMMVNNVPPDQIPRLRGNPNLHVIAVPSNRVMFVTLRTDRKPFNDRRVRQAMNYAIDREAITQGIFSSMAPVAKAPLPSGVYAHHTGLTPYPYDPERAKKLLAEAGASGATFNFGAPNGRYLMDKQVGETIAGYLDAIGLKVVFENPSWSTFVGEITKFEKAKYDGYMFGWGVVTAEPDQLLGEHFYSVNARRNFYNSPEVDRLLADARENFDDAKVRADYQKAQEILWQDCPWIWLYEQPDITAINKKLRGFVGRRDEYLMFWDASLDA